MEHIEGRAALVTGGSRGIGAAIARRLAEQGADVALTYERNTERADEVVRQIKDTGRQGLAIQADSADAGAVTAAMNTAAAELGRLDILVNNAAEFVVGPIEELGPEQFERTVAMNIRAPFVAVQAAIRHMNDGGKGGAGGGRIISIGSNVAVRTAFPGFSLYAMSKTALIGMTKGLARDLGPRGITVNMVNPGATDTELNPADGPMAEVINGYTALGHYAVPDDIAAMVAHLAGDGGRYVTGAVINVDGGFTA